MIGSLATLKSHLEENNIRDFKSLKEVMTFQSSYTTIRKQLISIHEKLIEDEKNLLNTDLQHLNKTIETEKKLAEQRLIVEIENLKQQVALSKNEEPENLFAKLKKNVIGWSNKKILQNKERDFDKEIIKSIKNLVEIQQVKKNRLEFIETKFNQAVNESAQTDLSEIDRKKSVIDESSNYIYGALGEQKVVKTLEALSDDYYLINDFDITFFDAIYNKRDNEYIKSVQIDHILVGPSGIFIIETKNWSEKSIENLNLRSPVNQIRRVSFILFKFLNNDIGNFHLNLGKHHWGEKKISIKNVIVLISTRPQGEFQYVKVVKLNELLSYVNYFKPVFSKDETQQIAEFLLKINDQKTI
ncbi:nuclease-related domain-containing protein [Pedobacter sp. Leaf132]|uniref:nuclease-related domain-containing protein n=1 Tax=Pedobacter sp. Leaf132 TaxID=2876557 RepID=UPI001E54920F|nr:nuclease-related domain-containing protein [Pedobacter sp. Leaf132]